MKTPLVFLCLLTLVGCAGESTEVSSNQWHLGVWAEVSREKGDQTSELKTPYPTLMAFGDSIRFTRNQLINETEFTGAIYPIVVLDSTSRKKRILVEAGEELGGVKNAGKVELERLEGDRMKLVFPGTSGYYIVYERKG